MTAAAWDAALEAAAGGATAPLLQSWAWGEVQRRAGWSVMRLHLPGAGVASVQELGSGPIREAYVPRGPVPAGAESVGALVSWARSRGEARLRIEPEAGPELDGVLESAGFRRTSAVQPRHTLILPLAADDEMLAGFKPKTRYNIRLADRRGVTIVEGADAEEMARQSTATARRQGISLASESYYRLLLDTLPWCRTFVATAAGEACAAILVAAHGSRAYYLYGGSNGAHRELMPSHAAQWAALRAVRDLGCSDYDMWGLPPSSDPSHPWAGLWQFKTGFGGRQVEYTGAWEITLSPWAALAAGRAAARRTARKLLNRS